jgi:hypothetical protein
MGNTVFGKNSIWAQCVYTFTLKFYAPLCRLNDARNRSQQRSLASAIRAYYRYKLAFRYFYADDKPPNLLVTAFTSNKAMPLFPPILTQRVV